MHKFIEQIVYFAGKCGHACKLYLKAIWNLSVKIYGQIANAIKKYWPIFLHLAMQTWGVFVELCRRAVRKINRITQDCLFYFRTKWPLFLQCCRRLAGWIKQSVITCSKTFWRLLLELSRWIAVQSHRLAHYCLIYSKIFRHACVYLFWWITGQVIRFARSCLVLSKLLWRAFIKLCRWIAIQAKRFGQISLLCGKAGWNAFVTFCWWLTRQIKYIARSCLTFSKSIWRLFVKLCRWIAVQLNHFALGCLAFGKTLWHLFVKLCRWIAVQIKRFAWGCLAFSKTLWHAFVNLCVWITRQILRFVRTCLEIIQLLWHTFTKLCRWIAIQIKRFASGCLAFSAATWRVFIKLCRWIGRQLKRFAQGCLNLGKLFWFLLVILCGWLVSLAVRFMQGCLYGIRIIWNGIADCIRWVANRIIHIAQGGREIFTEKWPLFKNRLYLYIQLTRLNKPIGIFLLLWPTLWALWIAAEGVPDQKILCIFILGVILMRSAGCVINDLADRNLDVLVARTKDRPIASGKVTPWEAITLAGILITGSFVLVLNLDPLALQLSFIAIVLAVIYPFMKRHTYLPQFFLGLAFGWAVPMAFAAETGSLPMVAWLLLFATVLWAVVYDTIYAMVDREDDIRAGIKSTAILFEDADRAMIGVIQLLVLLALIMVGSRSNLGQFYFTGIAIAAVLSIYQQYLIKDRIPEHCFIAFLDNNWFGAIIFTGLFLHYHFA